MLIVHECEVDGCARPKRSPASRWCKSHATRVRRYGEPGPATFRTLPTTAMLCCILGCGYATERKGMCLNHWRHWHKHGDPFHEEPIGSRKGEANHNWQGENITYVQAHQRVHKAKGKARGHTCISCGGPALHWAYDHRDLCEKHDENGHAYSTKVEHYEPLCVPCHKRKDLERLGGQRPRGSREAS